MNRAQASCVLILAITMLAGAQAPRPAPPRLPRGAVDRGAAVATMPLTHMLLLLRRTDQQEAALRTLLDAQRETGSPDYHRWLTPEAFGQRFGPDAADIAAVTGWLTGQGFTVEHVSPGGLAVEFSGSAGAVAAAWRTELHRYSVAGASYWANVAAPVIPAALTPMVAGIVSLNNVRARPMARVVGQGTALRASFGAPGVTLNWTSQNGMVGHAVAPGDLAVIYNLNPVYAASISGQGETIAVVARSDVSPGDVQQFRSLFLPGATGTFSTIEADTDPGIATNGDQDEATLDAEWAGALAPQAKVELVVSAGSATTDGVDLAALYIVDHDVAPVMTTSFGECEADMGATENQFWNSLWQQAAAEGITALVSAGDNGAAGCDDQTSESAATLGLAVSGLASTPYATAVGGTEFNEGVGSGSYWSSSTLGSDYHSVLRYIPEQPWDESAMVTGGSGLWAGSGGVSTLYAKPAWQAGTGVPADGQRDLPDVALAAAAHDGYVICIQNSCAGAPAFSFEIVSGTSAAAPTFAGIMALVDQKAGGAQGLANPVLYRLAAAEPLASCRASGPPAASCVLLDTDTGNNQVPCSVGTPDCTSGRLGYNAGPGYDLATGLGSVNASNLAEQWSSVGFAASATTLSLTPPANLVHGQSVPFSIQVAASGGSSSATPSGSVELEADYSDGSIAPIQAFTLNASGAVSGTTTLLPGGSYQVVARYAGDQNFGTSASAPVAVTVGKENTTISLALFQLDAQGSATPVSAVSYGALVYAQATVTGASGQGAPSGTVTISDGSTQAFGPAAPLNGQGQTADISMAFALAPGAYTFTAAYTGDASFNAATATASLSIAPGPLSIVIAADGPGLTVTIKTQSTVASPPSIYTVFSGASQVDVGGGGGIGTDRATGFQSFVSQWWPAPGLLPGATATLTVHAGGDGNYLAAVSNPATIATPGDIVFNPSTLDFGTVAMGTASAAQTVTLTNAGGRSAAVYWTLAGSNVGNFQEANTCGATLAPGASCAASYVFQPASAGTSQGFLADGDSELTLNGQVSGFTVLANLTGASIAAGQTATLPIQVTPVDGFTGTVSLSCTNLPPLANCSFAPAAVTLDGTHTATATLSLATTGPAVAPGAWLLWLGLGGLGLGGLALRTGSRERRRRWATLPLAAVAGLGLACGGGGTPPAPAPVTSAPATPSATVTPASLSFGSVGTGTVSAPQTVTVSNIGAAPIAVVLPQITAGAPFAVASSCAGALAAGASCPLAVTFAPKAAGSASGSLQIYYGGSANAVVALSGSSNYTSTPPGQYSINVIGASGAATAQDYTIIIVH